MIAFLYRLVAAALLLMVAGTAAAQERHVAVSLLPSSATVAPGQTVDLAIVMRPDPGWHGYWSNPGDAGAEPTIEWTLPGEYKAAPLRYPVPERLIVAGIMNYVFEHDYALLSQLTVPASAVPGTKVPLRAKLDYLVCTNEVCVPESAEIAAEVTVGAAGPRDAAFDRFAAALPRPLGSEARFAVEGNKLRLAIPLPAAMSVSDPYFFPAAYGALDHSAPQAISRKGDMLIVEAPAGPEAGGLRRIEGVLAIGEGQGLSLAAVPGTVPAAGDPVGGEGEGAGGPGWAAVPAALAGALLGGLLLNIMPCVFPILSLKALSLAKAGGDEGAARREALAYTAGVVLVCLALGGILLGLRAGGTMVGWAFQLQDPRVILLLLLLVVGIALNLAGLFELPTLSAGSRLAGSGGAGGAFWTGALAAFVATPCTGPFMAAALGAALVLPTAAALAIFAGLGLGLALPFLLLGFVPALRRRLPRPGAWMGRLRRILSVPMFLTAVALAWVLGQQSGVDGMAIGLAAALLLALGLWWIGARQGGGRTWLPALPALVGAAAAMLLLPADAPAQAQGGELGGEAFSEARLAALQAEGRPAFVYFTADWCITCKVNEKGVLARAEVADAFKAGNVAVLVGDWTRGDPAIGRFLETHGRSGVPLYLYYAPGQPPRILPQLLTVGEVTSLAATT